MKILPGILAFASLLMVISSKAVAQGHYEAAPNQSTKIQRNSTHQTKDKAFEVPVQVQLEYGSSACAAKLNLEYFQRGENAVVSATLSNTECDASFGSYMLQLRYRGADQEVRTRDYEETWRREDAQPVIATRQYFIGKNVDLLRVKSRRLTCTCLPDATGAAIDDQ